MPIMRSARRRLGGQPSAAPLTTPGVASDSVPVRPRARPLLSGACGISCAFIFIASGDRVSRTYALALIAARSCRESGTVYISSGSATR
ncbi:hypothetical protein BD311DRAFT_750310 [Dichomitus squalens]|uniref:Uncharacterized protein n=1 Tax=Dichomitus squalens TaxID=114155 RepID=A0A4Q9MWX6_9APHY|nr:hypothetical protein BD311DRAFT_750310 [Dichomitus squalens]